MAFKLTSKVVIPPHIWDVDYKWRLHDEDGNTCTSYVDWVGKIIWLDRAASREDKCTALVAEIIGIITDNPKVDAAEMLMRIFKFTFREESVHAVARAAEHR